MATGGTGTAIKVAKQKYHTMFDTGGLYIDLAPATGKWNRL